MPVTHPDPGAASLVREMKKRGVYIKEHPWPTITQAPCKTTKGPIKDLDLHAEGPTKYSQNKQQTVHPKRHKQDAETQKAH